MFIVHCPYPPRQVKKMIQHLLAKGAQRVEKINYAKSYALENNKPVVTKQIILYIYHTASHTQGLQTIIRSQYKECFLVFIAHDTPHAI